MESLPTRLSAIPAKSARPAAWTLLKPYAAFACLLAAALVFGNTLLRKTAAPAAGNSEEDIIEYLIDSGTTLAQICYFIDED